jgi:predicted PurR-regulated permease PerM
MRLNAIQHVSFFALLLLTTLLFFNLVQDFLQPVFWAAVLAILFRPVHRKWQGKLPNHPSIAALLTVLTVLFAVILPLFLVGIAVTNEAINLYEQIASGAVNLEEPFLYIESTLPHVSEFLSRFGIDVSQLNQNLEGFAVTASQFIASKAMQIGQDAVRFVAFFFIMLYLLFFFVRDGHRIMDVLIGALPLGDVRERRLFAKFAEVSRATIKGTIVVGVVQGTLGGLIFWILGINGPVFWGVVMAAFSVLPAVGAAIIWGPAVLVLFFTNQVVKAIILLVFGTVVISLVDNLLRPMLVGRDTRIPDYIILLATLGGLAAFGISGFVIGPVIAALFLVVWDIFQQEYSEKQDTKPVKQAALQTEAVSEEAPTQDELVHKEL